MTLKLTYALAFSFVTSLFYAGWYKRSRIVIVDKNAPWLMRCTNFIRFHSSYRIARAKHYRLRPSSRLGILAATIACLVPLALVTPVMGAVSIAGIIGPVGGLGTPVVMPVPNGVNDTATFQSVVTKSPGKKIILPATGKNYRLETVKTPFETFIEGENAAAVVIEFIGTGKSLFEFGGASKFKNFAVLSEKKQLVATTGAFDCSHTNGDNTQFTEIIMGNRFYNGFYCVGEGAGVGVLMFNKIEFQEPGTRVKEYTGAGWVLGGKKKAESRTIGVWITDSYVGVNTTADMANALEIQNTDSLYVKGLLIQNAKTGVRVGTEDESPLRTTNTFLSNVQADGCETGYFLSSLLERHQWYAISAEGCAASGIEQIGVVVGMTLSGGNSTANKNGFRCGASNTGGGNQFTGFKFDKNEEAGLLFEAATGGWSFTGGSVGNFEVGGKHQAFGFFSGAKCEHIHFKGVEFVKGPKAGEEQVNYTLGAESVDVDTEAQAKEHGCIFR